MRFLFLLLFLCHFQFTSSAQPLGNIISGRVQDVSQKPVAYATVVLQSAADSSVVQGAMTNDLGEFAFQNVKADSYFISAQFLGYEKALSPRVQVLEGGGAVHTLPALTLQNSTTALGEVVVQAQKPLVEVHPDKLVLHVSASALTNGGSALEALEKAPGVVVDQNDNISLQGKTSVLVLIDGKQSALPAAELATLLRNMPANTVETIEVIQNPGAKYDAAGNAGVLNLRLKKEVKKGYNGSVTLGTGHGRYPKTNAGLSMNYRTGKVNFFGNYSYSFNQRFFILDLQRKVEHEGQKTFFDQYNYRRSLAHNHTVRLGVDYFLGKNDVVGLLVDGIDNASTVAITNETHIREVLEGPVASSLGLTNDLESQGRNQMINVNYKHTFESSKTELSVNADYSLSSARQQDNILIQYQSTGDGERQPVQPLRSNSPSRITIRSVKADLSHPFSQGTKMEAGLKASQVFSDNNLFFEEYAQDHWQADAGRTNHFQYTELIGAAYANLNASFSQYKVQAGVRGEYTDADGHSLTLGQRTRQEYWKVFPSVLVSRKVTQANTLTFSYNRRIDRPAYRDLNPFIFFLDPFTYFQGNPYLRPQYTNNFQVSYAFLKELVVSAAYSQTADPITDVIKQDNASKIGYATRENLNQFRYANVSLVAPVNVTSWWRANTTFTVFYNHYQSSFLKSNLDAAQATAQFSTQQVVTLPNKLTAELAASYQSASVVGVIQRKPLYSMSLGIQKQVLAGKGTVRLSVQDLFNTNKVRTMVAYQNMDMQLLQHWESRVVRVGFTYNFGKGDQKPAATRKTGAEEENRRAVIQNQ